MILRRLFHVHSALAEFELAQKALDSYIEIVTSAKIRAEKAAESGELEDDATLLQTLSEGVIMLCCFGSYEEAEKAKGLIALLQKYAGKHSKNGMVNGENHGSLEIRHPGSTDYEPVPPSTIASTYRAIGIGFANWASWTPVNEARDDIRSEAIEYLEKSLAPEWEDSMNISSLYTLALLLSENRDLDGAIKCVKIALTSNAHHTPTKTILSRERDLVPLWHLLALLLSAKQDFEIAERSCEAAFELFPNGVSSHSHSDRRSPNLGQNGKDQYNVGGLKHALVGQLRGREKERIIETRMTQLAFIELSEGPEAAVNRSDQLLGLFATLYPGLGLDEDEEKSSKAQQLAPPKSSAGTVKSFRSSIFGRNRGSRISERRAETGGDHSTLGPPASDSQKEHTNGADAPAIQVTDEKDGVSAQNLQSQKLQKRAGSVKKSGSFYDQESQFSDDGTVVSALPQQAQDGAASPDMVGIAVSDPALSPLESQSQNAKQPLRPIAHNMKHTVEPPPAGHSMQPPEQDVRLPTCYRFDSPTNAVTRFPTPHLQKHALCVLVKIWLLIAGLYRRASLVDDAHEACEEASKHAARVEALVATQECSARAFSSRGWGSGRSCDELWADVYTERGLLSNSQSQPHDAMGHFEEALMRYPDHPKATIGLANLLLDIWDQKIPLDPPHEGVESGISPLSLLGETLNQSKSSNKETQAYLSKRQSVPDPKPAPSSDEEPRLLNRIAARERAYGLLSVLTKRGSSWDNSEAWFALSRAYEAGGQVKKLKEVLWWCIELEDRRPIRHWSNIGTGLYVL